MSSNLPYILSALVLLSNIVIVVVISLFLFSAKAKAYILEHLERRPLEHIFIFSLLASLGSLMLSDIVGFPPCDLCWFQRIFMYPQVIISLVALIRKEKHAVYYLLPLSVIGGVISFYQSYIQWGGTNSILPCTASGGACGKLYIYSFGYITIPFMALFTFAYLTAISLAYIYKNKTIAK